jgi:hypothetical protein
MGVVITDDPSWETYNTHCYQGSTWRRTFTWTDANGNPVDLTGATAALKVRKVHPATFLTAASVESAVISVTSGAGDILFDASNGVVQVTISASTTAAIDPGIYNYDLEIYLGSDTYKIVVGRFEIKAEATV